MPSHHVSEKQELASLFEDGYSKHSRFQRQRTELRFKKNDIIILINRLVV